MKRQQEIKDIYAKVFYLERLWNIRGDRWLGKDKLTTKQWFFLALIGSKFDYPPSIKEVAKEMNSSHQNVKAIASKLHNSGFIELKTDESDKRVKRIYIGEKAYTFFGSREDETGKYLQKLFKDISLQELITTHQVLNKLIENCTEEDDL